MTRSRSRRNTGNKSGIKSGILSDPSSIDLTEAQEAACPAFRAFLLENRTYVGDALLEDKGEPWDKVQMREIEEMIKKSDLDDSTAISYFQILHKVSICWIERYGITAELPRTALLIPEFENPFRMSLGSAFRNHRAWGDWLVSELKNQGTTRPEEARMSSIVPLLASAILYGGIWNEPELVALVKAIPQLLTCTMATANAIYVGLSVPWQGSGFSEHRCWQPDALTAILLMRTPTTLTEQLLRPDPTSNAPCATDAVILERIKNEFLLVAGTGARKSLCNFSMLIKSAVCIGYTQMPGVVAAYAHRRYMSHSLSFNQMQRISDKKWLFGLPAQGGETAVATTNTINDSSEVPPIPEWGNAISNALNIEDPAKAGVLLKELSTSITEMPLTNRIVDYAQRMILVPTIIRSQDTLKNFARTTVVLSSFMSDDLLQKDPADLPDEDLESSYRQMIKKAKSIPNGHDTVRDLISALTRFHSYLRNCHRKRRITGKEILVPAVLLDRVDVDILSRDEYLKIRRLIRFRWAGPRSKNRRSIATCLAILGYAGLRREEARLARIGDVHFEGWQVINVQESKGHSLKSESAERKIPGEVIPAEDLKILQDWHKTRRDSLATDVDWLFGSDEFKCISPAIFRALNQIISEVTGTRLDMHPTHFHHLRKSFCCWGLLRLLLPADCEPPDFMNVHDRDWLIAGKNFRPNEIRRTDDPSNSDVFVIGQLLGHLQGITTMSRYFFFCGELLRIYLTRSVELSPTLEQIKLAVRDRSRPENEHSSAQSPMGFAISLLGKMANSSNIIRVVKPSSAKQKAPDFMNKILDAWDLLSVIGSTNKPVVAAAADLGMNLAKAESIQNAAKYLSTLQSGNGEFRHRFVEYIEPGSPHPNRSIIPFSPNQLFNNEIMKRFAQQIDALRERSSKRELLRQGVNSYVMFLWDSRGCPVFADPEMNGSAASAFLNLLYELNITDKNIRFGSYDHKGSASRRKWRTVLGLRKRRDFEFWEVPFSDGRSFRPWLGIKPSFGSEALLESRGLFEFRFLMVMSFIVLRGEAS